MSSHPIVSTATLHSDLSDMVAYCFLTQISHIINGSLPMVSGHLDFSLYESVVCILCLFFYDRLSGWLVVSYWFEGALSKSWIQSSCWFSMLCKFLAGYGLSCHFVTVSVTVVDILSFFFKDLIHLFYRERVQVHVHEQQKGQREKGAIESQAFPTECRAPHGAQSHNLEIMT